MLPPPRLALLAAAFPLLTCAVGEAAASLRPRGRPRPAAARMSRKPPKFTKGRYVERLLQSGLQGDFALQGKAHPWGSSWFGAYSDEEVCGHLCKSQCTTGLQAPMCQNCVTSCMSFQICDREGGSEECLVTKACSAFAYNAEIKKGTQPDSTKPWEFCDRYPGDGTCAKCRSCIADGCHWDAAAPSTACGGPWGDCCMQRCLGAKPFPR